MAARKGKSGLKPYLSYRFTDKDPVVDELRTGFQDAGHSYVFVSEQSGVSTTTLYNWFHGPTRRPSMAAVAAVGAVLGFQGYDWMNKKLIASQRKVVNMKRANKE